MADEENWVMLEEPEPTKQEKLFAEAHKKATERIQQFEERVLTVIRGHLGAEQSLNALMKACRRRRKGRTFSGKWWVAKGLFVEEMTEELWEVLKIGNELRNAIAHGDKPGLIEAKIVELRKAYIDANTPAIARSTSAKAISGLDRAVRCSIGTRARFKRDTLLVQLSGRKRRNATITGTSPRARVSDTSVWQFAVLPREDAY